MKSKREEARKAAFFANRPGAEEYDWPNYKGQDKVTNWIADAVSDVWEAEVKRLRKEIRRLRSGGHLTA